MYCPHCRHPLSEQDMFCPNCGQKIGRGSIPQKRHKHLLWWLMPFFIILIAGGSLLYVYQQGQAQTDAAIEAFQAGEQYADQGQYQKAKQKFKQAIKQRKHFPAAKNNLRVVNLAIQTKKQLKAAAQARQQENFNQALKLIDKASNHLEEYQGPLIKHLNKKVDQARLTTLISDLKSDLEDKNSISELSPLLARARSLQGKKANKLVKDIRKQIVEYAYKQANRKLQNHLYLQALSAVNSGLIYDPGNERLLQLKQTIQQKQAAYEQQQQQMMEQAAQVAEEERHHNRHNAIKLLKIKPTIDDYGDMTIKGTIKSVATVPISSVTVSYKLLDKKQKVIASNKVHVEPYIIYPGMTATFKYTHILKDKATSVRITGFSWYLYDGTKSQSTDVKQQHKPKDKKAKKKKDKPHYKKHTNKKEESDA